MLLNTFGLLTYIQNLAAISVVIIMLPFNLSTWFYGHVHDHGAMYDPVRVPRKMYGSVKLLSQNDISVSCLAVIYVQMISLYQIGD